MELIHRVTAEEAGRTAGNLLRKNLGFSRATLRKLKRSSGVQVNGLPIPLNRRLNEGDSISIDLRFDNLSDIQPEPVPIHIVYEDQHLLVVNKPPGMLTHPLKEESTRTLANAVLHHFRYNNLQLRFRPVSRLDRDTSGLVVVAKHAHAAFCLAQQLHNGGLTREYLAVVHGVVNPPQGVVDAPIGRCPGSIVKHRADPAGRKAVTCYRTEKAFPGSALLRLHLKTGRTHQIRVHMSHIGHPLVGDTLYGGHTGGINRQALHCCLVRLIHPVTGAALALESPLPEDIRYLITRMESEKQNEQKRNTD
ncbi:MAG: RluA family pseudouridine synthase [Firmicutes bacterium]|nr:RluA family pseudouridine synthase [Bacillota bacterium]